MNIQRTFNSILSSVRANYGSNSEATKELQERRLALQEQSLAQKAEAQQAKIDIAKASEARKADELNLKKEKAATAAEIAEVRKTEAETRKSRATTEAAEHERKATKQAGKEALDIANAELIKAQAGAIKEKTAKSKAARLQKQREQKALDGVMMRTDTLNNQKSAIKERKQILSGEQVSLF